MWLSRSNLYLMWASQHALLMLTIGQLTIQVKSLFDVGLSTLSSCSRLVIWLSRSNLYLMWGPQHTLLMLTIGHPTVQVKSLFDVGLSTLSSCSWFWSSHYPSQISTRFPYAYDWSYEVYTNVSAIKGVSTISWSNLDLIALSRDWFPYLILINIRNQILVEISSAMCFCTLYQFIWV